MNVSSPFPSGRLQAIANHRLDLEVIGWLFVVFEMPDEESGAFLLSAHPILKPVRELLLTLRTLDVKKG